MWSATLLAFALSLTWALSIPAFWGVDETSHVAYAVEAASGNWPTIHTPNPVDDFPGLRERLNYDIGFGRFGRLDIWTANHPPLYFVLVGIPLKLGLLIDHSGAGMLVARIVTALTGSAGVLAVAWLAESIAPRRPRVAVIAAFCTALSPTLVHYAGQVYNDALAFTLSSFGLAAAFKALRDGLSRRLLVIGTVTAGAGALTRSSSLAVGAFVAASFALAVWFDRSSSAQRLQRLRAFLAVGFGAGALILLISGWAVIVNIVRYGDPTAASDLFDKFNRSPGPNWLSLMTSRRYALDQIRRFAAELSIGVWWPSSVTRIVMAALAAACIGGATAALRRWRERLLPDARGTWIGLMSGALPTLLLTTSAIFISRGGYPHSRYLLPGLAVMAVIVALGIDHLPRAVRGVPALAMLAALTVANVALWLQFRAEHQIWYQEIFPFANLHHLAPMALAVSVGLILGIPAMVGLVRAIVGLTFGTHDVPGEAAHARQQSVSPSSR